MSINLNIGQRILVGREGQQAVDINDMTVSRRHCTLTRVGAEDYVIEDVGSSRGTIADGLPVVKTRVKLSTPLMLGNYQTTVGQLLGIQVANKSQSAATPGGKPQETIHIGQLEPVYDNYEEQIKELSKRRGTQNIKRMLPMQILMPVVACGSMFINFEPQVASGLFKGSLMIGCVYLGIKLSARNVTAGVEMVEEQFEINKQFQIDYVCPSCKNFLGMGRPVKSLLNIGQCPYCKGRFVR